MRILNPLNVDKVICSVEKTGHLLVVDGGWSTCGLASDVISKLMEKIQLSKLKRNPQKITLPDAPAPTSSTLEKAYYPNEVNISGAILAMLA